MEQRYLLPSPLDVLENLAKKEGMIVALVILLKLYLLKWSVTVVIQDSYCCCWDASSCR